MKRYPLLLTGQLVLAMNPNRALIKIQTPDGRVYLSFTATTEVKTTDDASSVTALGIEFGTETSQEDFETNFAQEYTVESENENTDGQALTIDSASYGSYTDNVNLIFNPNEQLVDPANNQRYVLIVNADENNEFFGTWPPHK